MDFAFTQEQEMFRKAVRDFAQKEIVPIVDECDVEERYPVHLFKRVGELGYLGNRFPQEYGGSNTDTVTSAIMAEELAYYSGGIFLGLYVHVFLTLMGVAYFGSEEQKKKYLIPGITGTKIGAWGFAEPGAGSDPGSIRTRAVKEGSSYVLNGTKMFITNGTFADFVVVVANTAPERGSRGLSLVIVDRDTPGFTVSKKLNKLGMRASEAAELVFTDCRVPKENLLGEENKGFYQAMKTLTEGRIVAAAFATGMARAALDLALKYSRERVQFGQEIGKFQGIQWMLADMAVKHEAARWLTYHAAWKCDRGLPHFKEASMAKLFATEALSSIAAEALQIHGGYGFIMEYPIQRIYRDCKLLEIGEGTSQIHRNIIASQLLDF